MFCLSLIAAQGPATQPARVQLTGIDGKTYEPLEVTGHKAAVLVFILQDCPICNTYAPLVERLADKFGPEETAFYLVHVDPTLSTEDAKKHAADFKYKIPVLIDRNHALVQRLKILAVPTAVVIGADGQVQYKGRIDDHFFALGKSRNQATTSDLQDAIEAVLAGKPVKEPRTRVIGCAVPDLSPLQK
jgi:thiol-disulfide isomerase/thioredoxin